MKKEMIDGIANQLSALGVTYTVKTSADIVVNCEFLDAGWNTGNKKITYEASAYFDETSRTIFLWEFTKEFGSGFSFGGDSETSFQMGKTLFRKVKSVRCGVDGKAYEYTLDLGAIPKAFKEAAKAHAWKLKTVIKRENAMYPTGTPFQINNLSQPLPPEQAHIRQQDAMPQGQSYEYGETDVKRKKSRALWLIVFALGLLLTVTFFAVSGVSPLGWGLGAVVFTIMLVLQKKLVAKGCLFTIAIWIIVSVILLIILVFTAKPSAKAESGINTQQGQPAFYVSRVYRTLGAGSVYESPNDFSKATACLMGGIHFYIDANDKYSPTVGNKVSTVIVRNFQVVKKPAIGSPAFLTAAERRPVNLKEIQDRIIKDQLVIPVTGKQPDNEQTYSNYYAKNGVGHISFLYYVNNLGNSSGNDVVANTLPAIKKQGQTSDSLRSTIAFDIEIQTSDGQVFTRHMELVMVDGEFLKDKYEVTSLTDDYSKREEKMPFAKVK